MTLVLLQGALRCVCNHSCGVTGLWLHTIGDKAVALACTSSPSCSFVATHRPAQEDETFAQANQTASEAFTNIRTIAAFGMEGQVGRLAGLWAVSLAAV